MPKGHRVDAATVDAARHLVASGTSVPDAAQQLGLNAKTLYHHLGQRRSSNVRPAAEASVKQRLLVALAASDPTPMEVPELVRLVGTDAHSLTHIVWALQKQALVAFHEVDGAPRGITATIEGLRRAREQRPTNGRTDEAPASMVLTSEKVATRPDQLYDPEAWPELRRIAGQTRAVLQAVEALADVEGLEDVAELVRDSIKRSPVEDEYLRFVTNLNERMWRDAQTH